MPGRRRAGTRAADDRSPDHRATNREPSRQGWRRVRDDVLIPSTPARTAGSGGCRSWSAATAAPSHIFGLEGPGSPDLYGSWLLIGLAGKAMAVAGVASLPITATFAVVWSRNLLGADETDAR